MEKKKEVENSEKEQSENEKSEEFLKFEQGLKDIFSLTPEEARKIREEFPVKPPDEEEEIS